MTRQNDYFNTAQDFIQKTLLQCSGIVKDYIEGSKNVLACEIEKEFKQVELELSHFETALLQLEQSRLNNASISLTIIRTRRQFLEESTQQLQVLKTSFAQYDGFKTKNGCLEHRAYLSQPKSFKTNSPSNCISPNQFSNHPITTASSKYPSESYELNPLNSSSSHTFTNLFQGQQQLLLEKQDRTLDQLADVTDRMNLTATTIHGELQHQQGLLEELDADIERETEHMGLVMRRMAIVFKTSNLNQLCMILWLFGISVVLLFLLMI